MSPEQEALVLKMLVKIADTPLLDAYQERNRCVFCSARAQFVVSVDEFEHEPDCIVSLARQLRERMVYDERTAQKCP